MAWYYYILFASFILSVDAKKFPIVNASCKQVDYNLDHTLAMGIVNEFIVQVTINLELIMYPYSSLPYFTLSQGTGGKLDSLYPELKNLKTYRLMQQLAINDLPSRVSFSVQNEANGLNIYGFLYFDKDLKYFKQPFNQSSIYPIEYTKKRSFTYTKIISFWTGNDTEFTMVQLVAVENMAPYILHYTNRRNQNQMIVFVCFNGHSLMSMSTLSPDCIGSKDWIKEIRFGFIYNQRFYLVSINKKQIWHINKKFILNSNEYFPLKNEKFNRLFNCNVEKIMIKNNNDKESSNIIRILFITLGFFISLTVIIIIICIIFRQCSQMKKEKLKQTISRSKSSLSMDNYSTDYEINYLPSNKKQYMLFQYKVDTYI